MKTAKKSLLKEGYYYESKAWYDTIPQELTVPSYQTEIFPKAMTHQEIIDTYHIEPYKNIQDAFAVAADCIPTLLNDYKGRLVYFMDGDTRYRLNVYRDSGGELGVGVYGLDLGLEWNAGDGVLFSNETQILKADDTLALNSFEPLTIKETQAIEILKEKGFKITRVESKEVEY